ncbi:TrbC/VirB2 family protein [Sphingomonas psychrotolerans]|uniref:Type IV secretion system protein VirB2 n=1 Tax=Sphingomonas psychrotolerans TaxID=1327635 RepID=A0A2K8MJ48_9SPHN|nr:TrbC/VirB2 family protein [Sphingomonas psychrotolerans]ATY32586.1 hypothetical protein CVN68_11880 [Sphingomonas psychrotolerans]
MTSQAFAIFVSPSLADPVEPGPLLEAVTWLEGTALGTVATTVGVLVVAGIGLSMLAGRIHWRKGLTVVIGCFVLFGARGIAGGILGMVRGRSATVEVRQAEATLSPLTSIPKAPAPPVPAYDPYAGASVPPR